MLTSPNGAAAKNLHVAGISPTSSSPLAAVIDPLMEASENWMHKARDFVSAADDYVRNNPWQALGMMAMVGVTLGYFISRTRRS